MTENINAKRLLGLERDYQEVRSRWERFAEALQKREGGWPESYQVLARDHADVVRFEIYGVRAFVAFRLALSTAGQIHGRLDYAVQHPGGGGVLVRSFDLDTLGEIRDQGEACADYANPGVFHQRVLVESIASMLAARFGENPSRTEAL